MMRFYDTDTGVIRIKGKDVRSFTPAELTSMFGVVLQNDFLFIKKNNFVETSVGRTDGGTSAKYQIVNSAEVIKQLLPIKNHLTGVKKEVFEQLENVVDNIETMVRSIQHNCPNAEIIVAATIVANPASAQNKGQANYLEPLKEMVNRYQGVALLDMTTFSLDLLKIKTSFDLYANNINHPCDFMCRAYTANLLHLIEE